MNYAAMMSIKYSSDWLAMPRKDRNRFNEEILAPILARFAGKVSVRFFDAEAFSADVSDFALFEFGDPKDYYFLIEELRDTELYTKEWLSVKGILLGIEDGYQAFETTAAAHSGQGA
ncbi:darcynin family protein [Mesoterricola sediminis]|uniref:Darcynin 1 n=1 Tax=Mesoterricola sediminis TaxID=2927980 RepID=A0AA48GQZ7_9BACT|nr:darcynin family protein [Mesoterricola sediminis]BDU77651.1 hypothetical protein METESE_26090 [Mesoterricola sediminis]